MVGVGLVAAGCVADEALTPPASLGSTPKPKTSPASSEVKGGFGPTGAPASSSASTTPPPVSLTLYPTSLTLYVPSPGGAQDLYVAEAVLRPGVTGLATSSLVWQSSNSGVALVDASGRVQARRAGSATVTVSYQSFLATASVTVLEKGRLSVSATNLPSGAHLAADVYGQDGRKLWSGDPLVDLSELGNLTVEARALDAGGSLLGVGRWEGLTLVPNETTPLSLPLNVPTISSVKNGAAGAMVSVTGVGFQNWSSWRYGAWQAYAPPLTASVEGQEASVVPISDSRLEVRLPGGLAGSPATRQLALSVGGVTVSAPFKLVGALAIQPPLLTMSVGASHSFGAIAYDTEGHPVSGVALGWGVLGSSDFGAPVVGEMDDGGTFWASRAGTATVVVRQGLSFATASVTVQ